MYYQDLDKLYVIYRIEGTLVNESPLSVGSGRGELSAGPDNPVIRMGGDPYIPGSTIKGSLRSEAERFVRTFMPNEFVCDILNPKGEQGELERKKVMEKRQEEYKPCIVCRVFGGPTIASHLTVRDAIPQSGVRTEIRTSVSIHRITGGQYPGRLYTVEYVVPNSKFKFEMVIENIDLLGESNEAKLVRYLIKSLIEGRISLGRRRSIGMGKIRVDGLKAMKAELKDGSLVETDVTEKLKEVMR